MLSAVIVLLAAVNRGARGFAAFLAGLGFGLAWDELGKFITKDNNYFFRATPGLIYITFIALYLLVRYFGQRRFTQNDYMANVLDLLKDAAINDLDRREYEHAKQLLSHVSPNHHLYAQTKAMLESVKPTPVRQPSALDKAIYAVKWPLVTLSRQDYFSRLVIGVALVYGFTSLVAALFFFGGASLPDSHHVNAFLEGDESDLMGGVSALVSAAFMARGAYRYFGGRIRRAYKLFEQGLLVNIFIGQIVLFFKSQVVALIWLAITLLLLINLELLAADKTIKPSTLKNR
ncbi:hypothetical protein KW794_00850 [Candidatus Saccharibacteria bacterium]|nr:hypothetical protein [Candidatus Saccharibacteria bacterium]